MNENDEKQRREPIEALLPWYATRRLSDAEARSVEDALAADPDLARRLAVVEQEQAETVALNESLGAPTSRARDRLFAQIDATSPRRAVLETPRLGGLLAWLGDWTAGLSRNVLATSAAALVVLALLQAGFLATLLTTGTPGQSGVRFSTASGPGTAATEDASHVLVAFTPDATAAQITAFLEAHHAFIVDGPRPGGMFRVRIADKRLPEAEVARIVAAMRGQQAPVRFVAPAQ